MGKLTRFVCLEAQRDGAELEAALCESETMARAMLAARHRGRYRDMLENALRLRGWLRDDDLPPCS